MSGTVSGGRPPGCARSFGERPQSSENRAVFPPAVICSNLPAAHAFKTHGNHKVNARLFKVYELQAKERIHACMLPGGLDDQDPNDWDDEECKTAGGLNIPVAMLCSGFRRQR